MKMKVTTFLVCTLNYVKQFSMFILETIFISIIWHAKCIWLSLYQIAISIPVILLPIEILEHECLFQHTHVVQLAT